MKTSVDASPDLLASGLHIARSALERGRLEEARTVAEPLAKAHPSSADALALLGEVEYKQGRHAEASQWLTRATALERQCARAHWVLGNISQDAGQVDRAIAAYRRALRANGRFAEAQNDLGTAYFSKGWLAEAEQCYRQALELEPDNLAASENLAAVLKRQYRLGEARRTYVRVLKLRIRSAFGRFFSRNDRPRGTRSSPPGPGTGGLDEARKLLLEKRYPEAERTARAVLQRSPRDAAAARILAVAMAGNGRAKEAESLLNEAIARDIVSPDLRIALGDVLANDGQYAKALEAYEDALMLDPGNAPAKTNMASVLHALGHFREAEAVYRLSLEDDPNIAAAHSSLAGTLISIGKFREAEAAARKSLELKPESMHAALMLANALQEQGRIAEAREIAEGFAAKGDDAEVMRWLGVYEMLFNANFERAEHFLRQAIALAPQMSSFHLNLARCLLVRGRFAEGWEEYEWRKREPARTPVYTRFPYPEWDGSPLKGKAIAVNGEQGLGDEIMFASCLADIQREAARCVLYCNRRLEALFRRSFPGVEVVAGSHLTAANDPFPVVEGIDWQVAAGSLPRHFRRNSTDFPAHHGYLSADPEKEANWRSRLADLGPGLKIGISWKGGTPLSDVTRRTPAPDEFFPLLRQPGVHWVSLQYGDSANARKVIGAAGVTLHHWQEAVDDLDETAALISALDLRLSVCNTQVHLSGALGKEVWVLAPLSPDARYGYQGERMIWYPAVRMFRQERFGDWRTVMQRTTDELARRVSETR